MLDNTQYVPHRASDEIRASPMLSDRFSRFGSLVQVRHLARPNSALRVAFEKPTGLFKSRTTNQDGQGDVFAPDSL